MNDFFATVYELLYYKSPFSEDLYRNSLYHWPGFFLVLLPGLSVVVFYKLLDHPRYHMTKHWFFTMVVCFLCQGVFCLFYLNASFQDLGLEYSCEKYWFVVINIISSAFLFFIFSFPGQWSSRNTSETPFALRKIFGRK